MYNKYWLCYTDNVDRVSNVEGDWVLERILTVEEAYQNGARNKQWILNRSNPYDLKEDELLKEVKYKLGIEPYPKNIIKVNDANLVVIVSISI